MKTQKKKKKRTKTTKKSLSSLMDNLSPVGGLLVFVGMVVYRNYLLSVNSSEAVMLHHFKRQFPPVSMNEGKSHIEKPGLWNRYRKHYHPTPQFILLNRANN